MENSLEGLHISTPQQSGRNAGRHNKRQGKGSRSMNIDKYRTRINHEVDQNNRREISARLGLLDSDELRRVKEAVSNIKLTQQPVAIPISTTTRSVGFAVALFYDRAVTTWNLQQIEMIATIHQVYRVALWAMHFKIWNAQSIQIEPVSVVQALQYITIEDQLRSAIAQVGVLPTTLAAVLNSVGRIQTQTSLYHSGYSHMPQNDDQQLEYRALVVNPDNIRDTLLFLADVNSPAAAVQWYQEHNSIPGLYFVNGHLVNTDDIYPAGYDVQMLNTDVTAFNNLVTRVQGRLPPHQFAHISWHGKGDSGGLWSNPVARVCVTSDTEPVIAAPRAGARRRRLADGSIADCDQAPGRARRYLRSTLCDAQVGFHSLEATNEDQAVTGTISLTGEECFISTRYTISGRSVTSASPIQILRNITDLPR